MLRRSFATHLHQGAYDIRTVQSPAFRGMGHSDVKITVMFLHVLHRGGRAVRSPHDNLYDNPAGMLCRNHITPVRMRPNGNIPLDSRELGRFRIKGVIPRIRGQKVL